MERHDKPTNDVPLSSAEIAGLMDWRGPGAYTIHAERRIVKLIAESVKREREACAKACEDQEVHDAGHPGTAFKVQGMCIAAIRARGGE